MRFQPDTFLWYIKQIVTGLNGDTLPNGQGTLGNSNSADGGIKVDRYLPLSGVVNLVSGTAITLAETGMSVLQTAAAVNAGIGHVSFQVPRDYDEASDHFALRILVQLVAADAGITLIGQAYVKPLGGAAVLAVASTSATLPFSTTAVPLSTTEQFVELNFSGLGLKRNSVIDVRLNYNGTTSDVANIYGVEYGYDSTIVSYNETDATEGLTGQSGVAGNLIGFGNPLR